MQRDERMGAAMVALREQIDQVDDQLVQVLVTRFRLVAEVGSVKASLGMMRCDPLREATIVRRVSGAARTAGIPEEGVRDVFWTVLSYCRSAVARGQTAHPSPGTMEEIS